MKNPVERSCSKRVWAVSLNANCEETRPGKMAPIPFSRFDLNTVFRLKFSGHIEGYREIYPTSVLCGNRAGGADLNRLAFGLIFTVFLLFFTQSP